MGIKAILPWNTKRLIASEVSRGGRFDEFSYPAGALSKFKIVQFHRQIPDGTVCYGLGCGLDQKTAHLKAFYEFLERKAFFERGVALGFQTTNGIAIHKFKSLAARSALAELIERDAFLIHWYGQLPFQLLGRRDFADLEGQIGQLRSLGYETIIAKTLFGLQPTFVTFLVNTETSGFVVGTSSGKSRWADMEKSFIEACTNLFLVGTQDDDGSFARIKEGGIQSLRDHRAFWLFAAGLPSWAFQESPAFRAEKIDYKPDLKYHVLSSKPLPTIGVTDQNMLQIRIGPPSQQDHQILKQRIRFLDREIPKLHEMAPHPIP